MDSGQPLAGDGQHAEGIGLPQILLGGQGKAGEILERMEIVGTNAPRVEQRPVVRHMVIGMAKRPFEPAELQARDLVTAGDLDRIEIAPVRRTRVTHCLP